MIFGLRLRWYFNGIRIEEKNIRGKLDTGSEYTCIPLNLARGMCLSTVGKVDGLRAFDSSLEVPQLPLYKVQIFVPKWGWTTSTVLGCQRDDILLGLDYCKGKLLLANWRSNGFGLKRAKLTHWPLQKLLFTRLKKLRAE